MRRTVSHRAGKDALASSLRAVLQGSSRAVSAIQYSDSPYPELGRPSEMEPTSLRQDVVFVTARFRTGSTLLWNLFRSIDACTAYYEPFNERRWFDPATRGERVDATHKGVSEYWREYQGLEELADWYEESWIDHELFMDRYSWNPKMKRFIEILVERSRGRPVLQFNRVDFRLPWLRHHFPNASIVHVYRHPRDQWCSSLMDIQSFPRTGSLAEFAAQDKFYLLRWADDLKYQFPFLDPQGASHPYDLFYYLWKLSYLFGLRHADCSVSFEALVQDPKPQVTRILDAVGLTSADPDQVSKVIQTPALGKWKAYADADWFEERESTCEAVLARFLAPETGARSELMASTLP